MKFPRLNPMGLLTEPPVCASRSRLLAAKQPSRAIGSLGSFCLILLVATLSASAQTVRFRSTPVRVTVPLLSTNSTTISNNVAIAGLDTNSPTPVTFDVTGLPAGAGFTLTDTNGNALLSTTQSTNLILTILTTNIPEGSYSFSLDASGGATNSIPFTLQAAHVWNGTLDGSNNWAAASSWLGGVPVAGNDAVIGDIGAQTNSNFVVTNIGIDSDTTVGSIRFAHNAYLNASNAASVAYHTVQIAAGKTLFVTGTNGFSLWRDGIDEFADQARVRTMNVNIQGGAGSKLVVSNANANFAVLISDSLQPTLTLSNLDNLITYVSRVGLAEYQLFPNFRNYNDTNNFGGSPERFLANIFLARTNVVTAVYKDADNYTNEFTRSYAMSFMNSELQGNGSGTPTLFYLGQSNAFFLDSICLVRANHATGNSGAFRFNPAWTNGSAQFRGTNGGRMSVFTIADDGGTNFTGDSNVRAVIDFSLGNGSVDILADRFYMARDRTLIASNSNPAVESTLTLGRGTIDANTAILGFQEHDGKTDWPTIGGAQAYRNYCRGDVVVTNGGTFRVNRTLTLGFTADTNPEASALQFNTRGTLNIYSGSTVTASNIIADGGLNFQSIANPRQNAITINSGGTLIVTNTIGSPVVSGAGDPAGLPLDTLTLGPSATLSLFVGVGKTNVFVRNLVSSGSTPGFIKIASLPAFPSYPTNVPLISYQSATPFLAADMSSIGGTVQGYILNNTDNHTIDLFLTTNAPKTLTWTGATNSNWDLTTYNWITTNGVATNFALGDIVIFDDSSSVTNINITDVVVPNQSSNVVGVTVNASLNYTFTPGGGSIAGTARMTKTGSGNLTMNAAEAGPISILGGSLDGSGFLGTTVVASNVTLNFAGNITGGLTSTGTVFMAAGSIVSGGALNIRGGLLVNAGNITASTSSPLLVDNNSVVTNTQSGVINIDHGSLTGNSAFFRGNSTLVNYGIINNVRGRLNLGPGAAPFDGATVYGSGFILDSDGGITTGNDGRLAINPSAVLSPGSNFLNTIGTMYVGARVDLNNTPASGIGILRIEVDFNDPQTNDIVLADKWNNITGMILMTNINPNAGTFANGQTFQIFQNNNGLTFSNSIDVNGTYPLMSPVLPGPGLQWGMYEFRTYGFVTVTNTPLIWDGGDGFWNTTSTNWKNSLAYGDNQGAMFDDSASGTTTITLTNIVTPGGFANQTNIVGTVTNISLKGPAMSPGIVISNSSKDYVFLPGATNSKISGLTGIYKTGPGTLTILLTNNDFTGSSYLFGGTVVITNINGFGGTANANGVSGNNNELFIDGGTLKYTAIAPATANYPRAIVINPGGATIEVASTTNEIVANSSVLGAGSLTKTGPGMLALNQSGDSFAGGTFVNDGTLRVAAAGAASSNTVTLNGGALMLSGNAFTLSNAIVINGAGSKIVSTNNYISAGVWSGAGSVTVSNTAIFTLNNNISAYSGALSLGTNAGNLRFNNVTNANNCLGSSLASFDLGSGSGTLSNFNGGGFTYNLGSLAGGANTILGGRSSNATAWAASTIYSIGANGNNTAFNGRIVNGNDTVSVVKVGTGSLLLNGNNTYSGLTTVSSGTLGGTGVLSGPVTVSASGTLAPGASIGTLTINNTLTNAGTVAVEVSRNGVTLTSDRIVGLTSVTFGGALVVSNVGPSALQPGDSFQLFNTGGTGNFTSITPALAAPLAWSFNPGSGVLSVIDIRPVITVTPVGGGTGLQFSWSNGNGYTFKLQAQTNGLTIGITSTWYDYPGGGTSPVTVTFDPANPAVFYRLINQ